MKPLVALACALPFIAFTAPAWGDSLACGPRAAFVKHLTETWGETPRGRGLSITGKVLEIFISPQGTWTVAVTRPDGYMCPVDTGEYWEAVTAVMKTGPGI